MMVVDLQGVGSLLTDTCILTKNKIFGPQDLGNEGM